MAGKAVAQAGKLMSELRYNVTSRDWVVIAPERSRRPEDFHHEDRPLTTDRPAHRGDCPFCPGSEEHTPDESLRYSDSQGNWLVRAFPNRYPAFRCGPLEAERGDLFRRRRGGQGEHEVVAESRLHNVTFPLQPVAEVELVLRAWRERHASLSATAGIEHVVIFKNHGVSAGTSLEHPHSQVIGLPVVPASVRNRMEDARRYTQKRNGCLFCDMLEVERRDGLRIVAENPEFVAFVPFAAYSPYSLWIFPRRHCHAFCLTTDAELAHLAQLLHDVLGRLYRLLRDPDYNLVLRSAAPPGPGTHYFHYYLAIIPRLSKLAGFEMGTGMFINGSSPEEDARQLRSL